MSQTPSLDDTQPNLGTVIPRPVPEILEGEVKKGLRVVERILSSTDDELISRKFLLSQFYEYGIPKLTPSFFKPWEKYMNPGGFGALQVPSEYIDMMRTLMPLGIRTAIEIGVYRGGFSYFTAAILQRVNPDFELTLVDPYDSLLGFDRFAAKLNLKKAIPATSEDFIGQAFDFVFIDGLHTYEGAIADWRNVGVHFTKAMGFHDIHDHTPSHGTVRAWDEIKSQCSETHEIYEFAHAIERGLGIGLVVNPDAGSRRYLASIGKPFFERVERAHRELDSLLGHDVRLKRR